MLSRELGTTWAGAGLVAMSATAMLLGLVVYVRLVGLRSFSKMSSFDFAVTVAFGSLLAAVTMSSSSLLDGLIGAAMLFAAQATIAFGRLRFGLGRLVDNDALLLMEGPRFLPDNLRHARVTEYDVRAKLREANVTSYDEVFAVVLESTGDISVLHGDGEFDEGLLDGVRRDP